MTAERVRARVLIRGRVQGVWFRQSTADHAISYGVDGWARNLADGSVEAVFEGAPAAVERALDFARVGPERARVDEVEVAWEDPRGEAGFAVR
jgi:acylphosphatase